MKLKYLAVFFILIFWPLGLIIHNQNADLFSFVAPTILLAIAYKYYRDRCWYYIPTLVLIGLLSSKMLLFPLLFLFFEFLINKPIDKTFRNKLTVALLVSVIILTLNFQEFRGQTVFTSDYEAQQLVIRNQQLYPTPFTARVFHNKFRIVGDKIINNFFELTDPNNYFFGFAPRQVIGNQNLQKFPFLAILPFVYGLYHLSTMKEKKFILVSLIAALLNLSILTVFDKNDFILYLPFTLLTLNGLFYLSKNFRYSRLFSLVFVIFSCIEFVRIFLAT